jgi:hypothetical protein
VFAGKPGDRKWFSLGVMSWVYPEVLKKDSLWSTKLFRNTDSPYTEIETLFAYDPSVWVGCGGPPDLVKRIGLPVFNCSGSQTLRKQISLPNLKSKVGCGSPSDTMRNKYSKSYLQGGYYSENYLFPELRSYSALIGNAKLAEMRIDAYCQKITDLQRELQPSDLVTRPRALAKGEDGGNLPRAGIVDAGTDRKIPGDDAERLLVMDPDIIFLAVGSPKEYMSEACWQGLKAVRDRRVYRRPGLYEWWATGMTFKPIEVRWMAEVAHPDRLQPKVRQLLGERVMSEFGYRLSDDQIDQIFHVADNAGSVGAERFTRNYQTTNNQRLSK